MADYKSMYYHLAGRTATAVDILEATTTIMQANVKSMEASVKSAKESVEALIELKEKLKQAQLTTEEMFMDTADDDDVDNEE